MVITPLRQTCPGDIAVMLRLCEMLADVGRAAVASEEQSEHVARQLDLVERAYHRAVPDEDDLKRVKRASQAVEVALAGKPPRSK